jgi:O-antigen/teichoic acid export membrane protein
MSSQDRSRVVSSVEIRGAEDAPPAADAGPTRRSLSTLANSMTLIVGKVSTMGLGFVFWLIAARLFRQTEVGLAAGAVAATMLCTQLALLGVGSSFIVQFPRHQRRPARLLDTSFTLISISSLIAAGIFLVLAATTFHQLRVIATQPLFAASFAAMTVLGTAGILFDQVSTALRRGDQMLLRAMLFGLLTVSLLGLLAFGTSAASAMAIFSTWVGAGLAAAIVGQFQLWRIARYHYRPRFHVHLAWPLLRIGLPNHFLTLCERAPGLILPIIVTELVSPAANAAWYTAWMMAWVVYIVPIQVGINLFAEAAHRPETLRTLIRHGIRSSLAFGLAGAAVLAGGAHVMLSILGSSYAAAGVTPLRILVLAVVPLTFTQAYFIVCRARERWFEAIATGVANAATSVGLAAVAGVMSGLTAMALCWLGVQVVTSSWATWRLVVISRRERAWSDQTAIARSAADPVSA